MQDGNSERKRERERVAVESKASWESELMVQAVVDGLKARWEGVGKGRGKAKLTGKGRGPDEEQVERKDGGDGGEFTFRFQYWRQVFFMSGMGSYR